MSNSKLATVHYWTNNKSSRNGTKITSIIIHHMATVNGTALSCYNVWKSRQGSAHYAISTNGQIGQLVDEKFRAWSAANAAADSKSVTIELANSTGAPSWKVSDKAIEACIKLCVDICQRNGIKKLTYTGNKSGNLLMHCWFASTACPGPYLKTKFTYIANEVNRRLGSAPGPAAKTWTDYKKPFTVRVTDSDLYIRKGPGIAKYGRQTVNGSQFIKPGVYTITDVKTADGYTWGKLKSSTAASPRWIALEYAVFVKEVSPDPEPKPTPTPATNPIQKLLDACKAQSVWMKNYTYIWESKPTIAKSKTKGTCVTYVACVLQRVGVLKSGQYIWTDGRGYGNGKVTGIINDKMVVSYMDNKSLSSLKSSLKAGDIIIVDDNKSGKKGNGGHIFILSGKWVDGSPYIWDNNTAKKNQNPIKYNGSRKVLARIRIKESALK